MKREEFQQHLSQISTMWTMLLQAHQGSEDEAAAARQLLMVRYCGAVYRYLLGALRNPEVAEDLTQEFALRFVQGRFGKADRTQGRFRNYVKTALFHLVDDWRKGQLKGPRVVALQGDEPVPASDESAASDQAFRDSWRQELLARTWEALQQQQNETGQPFYEVLHLRAEQPDLTSPQLAEQLSTRLGRPFSAAGVRQLLHRARERFAELLVEETRRSLEGADSDQLHEELADLNLLKYCQGALRRPGDE
jgi:RNA polymerase sigma-70 factor (ECF subfamily)